MRLRPATLLGLLGLLSAGPAAAQASPASLCLATLPETSPDGIWAAWSFSPWVIVPLLAVCAAYGRGLLATCESSRLRIGLFAASILCLVLALVSPLCRLSTTLAWAHMVQHVLLVAGAPLLLSLARPSSILLAGLPGPIRSTFAMLKDGVSSASQQHAYLLAGFLLYGANIWFWHVPSLYEGALLDTRLHLLMYASLLAASLMFWHAALACYWRPGTLAALAVALLFFTFLHTGLLGILLTLSPRPWYPLIGTRSAAWGLSPLDDQQLAGLIMWVPMGGIYVVAALALFGRLISASGQPGRGSPAPGPT